MVESSTARWGTCSDRGVHDNMMKNWPRRRCVVTLSLVLRPLPFLGFCLCWHKYSFFCFCVPIIAYTNRKLKTREAWKQCPSPLSLPSPPLLLSTYTHTPAVVLVGDAGTPSESEEEVRRQLPWWWRGEVTETALGPNKSSEALHSKKKISLM